MDIETLRLAGVHGFLIPLAQADRRVGWRYTKYWLDSIC